MHRSLKYIVLCLILCLLSACTRVVTSTAISLDFKNPTESKLTDTTHIKVEIIDLRRDINMRRTALNVTIDEISLSPPETEIIKQLIVNAVLSLNNIQDQSTELPTIYCGIKAFDIETPSTPLYWDVTTRIELVLRVQGKERTVSDKVVERTWLYPSLEIIERVTIKALQNISIKIGESIPEFLNSTQ